MNGFVRMVCLSAVLLCGVALSSVSAQTKEGAVENPAARVDKDQPSLQQLKGEILLIQEQNRSQDKQIDLLREDMKSGFAETRENMVVFGGFLIGFMLLAWGALYYHIDLRFKSVDRKFDQVEESFREIKAESVRTNNKLDRLL